MRKQKAADNPWGAGATTLEWTLPSPPPFHQYNELPLIPHEQSAVGDASLSIHSCDPDVTDQRRRRLAPPKPPAASLRRLEPSIAGVGDYVALMKPRVMSLVVFTALSAW